MLSPPPWHIEFAGPHSGTKCKCRMWLGPGYISQYGLQLVPLTVLSIKQNLTKRKASGHTLYRNESHLFEIPFKALTRVFGHGSRSLKEGRITGVQ